MFGPRRGVRLRVVPDGARIVNTGRFSVISFGLFAIGAAGALALLISAPPSATAAVKTRIEPPHTTSSFSLRASNRYYVEFEAVPEGRRGGAKVTVEASYLRYKDELLSVTYTTRGRFFKDGGFEAKLPGLGRVAVHFKQTKSHKSSFAGPTGCTREVNTLHRGSFVGFVAFHGKGGFTVAKARRAEGRILETNREVCQVSTGPEPEEPPAPEVPVQDRTASIFASGQSGPAAVTFETAGPRQPDGATGSGLPTIEFEATYRSKFRGMGVSARAYVDSAHSNFLSVPTPIGTLTDATVTPPLPFSGVGVFHLETPTTASWSGELAVTFPGIGDIALTGPGITARLCEEMTCTATGALSST
jgi:hypothetical protein